MLGFCRPVILLGPMPIGKGSRRWIDKKIERFHREEDYLTRRHVEVFLRDQVRIKGEVNKDRFVVGESVLHCVNKIVVHTFQSFRFHCLSDFYHNVTLFIIFCCH